MTATAGPMAALRHEGLKILSSRLHAHLPSPWQTFFALVALYAVTSAAACLIASHLVWNGTASLPRGFYWKTPCTDVHAGDVVAFRVPPSVRSLVLERQYLPGGSLLMKPVVAVEGDPVCVRNGVLFVRGGPFGRVLTEDSEGRGLPQFTGCGPVPSGHVFVASHHPQSFDSRTFGPVDVRALQGTVTPLWIH